MRTIDLPHGRVHYRVAGPEDSAAPPVLLVHGALVNHELWTGVADRLAEQGIRSYAPDLPLGSHRTALDPGANLSPRGIARLMVDFMSALDLDDVTLVGNDTGGALCQFLLDTDATHVGRLLLTNCDAFDQFPPRPFDLIFKLGRRPGRLRLMAAAMTSTALRHSLLGYGGLAGKPLEPALSLRWISPARDDPGVRRDAAALFSEVRPDELVGVATRLHLFGKPVRLVWGTADRFFKPSLAHRLRAAFGGDTELVLVDGGRTFLPLDEPERVAAEIAAMSFPRD